MSRDDTALNTDVSTVLIVDDEKLGRTRLELVCAAMRDRCDVRVLTAASIGEAIIVLGNSHVHVVLLDKNLSADENRQTQSGIDAIPRFLQIQPHLQIIMITGSRNTQDVARAMSLGAFWFLPKETSDDLIKLQITKALDVAALAFDKIHREIAAAAQRTTVDLAGRSAAVTKLKARLRAVAETSRPVLLLGETGCGKTTAAKLIHEYRKTALRQPSRPFFSVHMGAISPTLAERELFGHEQGAFTDAHDAKPGIFEKANGGTLFLDEIGEAPLDLQTKLLKVIEEGRFVRLGDTRERSTAFKLILATNRNLDDMVANGTFREDLYMRISTFRIVLPTLAERRGDIPNIIRSLLPKCCEDNNVRVDFEDLPADFVDYLVNTPLRGNVRGIEQQLSRLLTYSRRDLCGVPILAGWREVVDMDECRPVAGLRTSAITTVELRTRPVDIVGPGFQGLKAVTQQFVDRVVVDALGKFRTAKEAAAALKISQAAMSSYVRRLNGSSGLHLVEGTNESS